MAFAPWNGPTSVPRLTASPRALSCRGLTASRFRSRKARARRQLNAFRREVVACVAAGTVLARTSQARAGPFVSFLSDILPITEAQRSVAKADMAIREGVNSMTEIVVSPSYAPKVPDAVGAEQAVLRAGEAAAAAAGLDMTKITSRIAELADKERSRLRGRTEAGLFETEMLGSVTYHMVANLDKPTYPAFQAYCTWKAYDEALSQSGKATIFRRVFGQKLLAELSFPQPPSIRPQEAASAIDRIQAALDALIAAGFCAKAVPQIDEVLVEIWADGGSRDLVLPVLIEGDPLVDAQILLSEETTPSVLPDPIVAALTVWFEQAGGPGYPSLETYYVNSRWRGKTEYSNMVYVPKQRLFQLTLHRSAASAVA
ncbi:unnamed protein product [Effrenium voratum]|nr:unnamed protein product [Effrenium voratum]